MCIIPGSTPFVNPFSLDILPDIFGLSQRFLRYSRTIYYMAYGKCRSQRYAELGTEPTGRKNSRIKTCRLEGDPPVHTVPQCGPERRKTGFLDRNSYIFKVFVQSANGVIFREVTPALTSEYQWRLRRQQIYRGQLWLQGTFVDCTGVYNEKA